MSAPFNSATLPSIEQAAREEYEYYGSTLTTNTALKVITVILSLVIAVLRLRSASSNKRRSTCQAAGHSGERSGPR